MEWGAADTLFLALSAQQHRVDGSVKNKITFIPPR